MIVSLPKVWNTFTPFISNDKMSKHMNVCVVCGVCAMDNQVLLFLQLTKTYVYDDNAIELQEEWMDALYRYILCNLVCLDICQFNVVIDHCGAAVFTNSGKSPGMSLSRFIGGVRSTIMNDNELADYHLDPANHCDLSGALSPS
jgi:hypothetical protein